MQVEDTKIRIGRALLAQVDDAHQKAMIRKEEQKKLMGQLNYFQFFLVNPPFSGISRKKLVYITLDLGTDYWTWTCQVPASVVCTVLGRA